jgi:ER degradation enhancer, mannosidase alpha-like 1
MMYFNLHLSLLLTVFVSVIHSYGTRRFWDERETKYGYFDDSERLRMLEATREMFYFGYDNYMKYAFPMDELDPIHCTGRGPDYDNP